MQGLLLLPKKATGGRREESVERQKKIKDLVERDDVLAHISRMRVLPEIQVQALALL